MDRIVQDCDEPIDALKEVIATHVELAITEPSSSTVFSDEWKHLPEEELKIFLKRRKKYEAQLSRIIDEGKEKGVFKGYFWFGYDSNSDIGNQMVVFKKI